MKKIILNISLIASLLLFQSFINENPLVEEKSVVTNSKIVWKGYKVTGSHEGTIDLKSGSLTFEDEKLTGGEFVLDMTSIKCTDLSEDYAPKLEGHLKSEDFFSTDTYPTAKLKITKAKSSGKNTYKVKADITIKEITKSIKFDVSVYGKKATASLTIDRTDFNVKYGSGSYFDGLKDKLIYDDFDIVIDLEF